jgi:hypothetical protein
MVRHTAARTFERCLWHLTIRIRLRRYPFAGSTLQASIHFYEVMESHKAKTLAKFTDVLDNPPAITDNVYGSGYWGFPQPGSSRDPQPRFRAAEKPLQAHPPKLALMGTSPTLGFAQGQASRRDGGGTIQVTRLRAASPRRLRVNSDNL